MTAPEGAIVRVGVDATRARILAATRALFAGGGSRGTTTREVATRAGVNEATIFRHFGNKHALLHAMREEYCGRESFREALAQLTGVLESDLRILGRAITTAIAKNADLIRVSLGEETLDPDGSALAWRGPTDVQHALIAYMAGRVQAGELRGKPEDLARFFIAMLFAHVISSKLWLDGRYADDRITDLCIDIFLNGVRAA